MNQQYNSAYELAMSELSNEHRLRAILTDRIYDDKMYIKYLEELLDKNNIAYDRFFCWKGIDKMTIGEIKEYLRKRIEDEKRK